VACLKKYNFVDGGEAEKVAGFGKSVMPSLVARLKELPGRYAESPRSYAGPAGPEDRHRPRRYAASVGHALSRYRGAAGGHELHF